MSDKIESCNGDKCDVSEQCLRTKITDSTNVNRNEFPEDPCELFYHIPKFKYDQSGWR